MYLWVLALLLMQPVALHGAARQTRSTAARKDLQVATHAGPTQDTHLAAPAAVATPAELLGQQSLRVSCSADTFSKQSCLFNNVCFLFSSSGRPSLTVVLQGAAGSSTTTTTTNSSSSSSRNRQAAASRAATLLKQHLGLTLEGQFDSINYLTAATAASGVSTSHITADHALAHTILHNGTDTLNGRHQSVEIEHAVTLLWRTNQNVNQNSFGHALINEAFPMFLVLSNHFGQASGDIPRYLQLLVCGKWHPVLQHVVSGMITHNSALLAARLAALKQQGKVGVCFRHLLLGDGGHLATTFNSLANSGGHEAHTFSQTPSIFSSRNWWAFRTHALQVAGVVDHGLGPTRPLILINDKRHHDTHDSNTAQLQLKSDRRMILGVDQLAEQLRTAYPNTDVVAARFRDMQWPDQLRLISAASVFITTQGSSAFRLVFLSPGATCVVVGAPEEPGTSWRSFHELDRWFPLSYVTFERYHINVNASSEYVVSVKPGHWQPPDATAAKQWWMYNADVWLQVDRLRPMIDRALGL